MPNPFNRMFLVEASAAFVFFWLGLAIGVIIMWFEMYVKLWEMTQWLGVNFGWLGTSSCCCVFPLLAFFFAIVYMSKANSVNVGQ